MRASLLCAVLFLTIAASWAVDEEEDVPYYDTIDIVKVHIPLAWWQRDHHHHKHDTTTRRPSRGSSTSATEPPSSSTESDMERPDAATVDVIFDNMTRLDDNVTAFDFSGPFELLLNITDDSVDMMMTKWMDEGEEEEQDNSMMGEELQIVLQGPLITGVGMDDDEYDSDDYLEGDSEDDADNDVEIQKELEARRRSGRRHHNHHHHHHRHHGGGGSDYERCKGRGRWSSRNRCPAVRINGHTFNDDGYLVNATGTFQMNITRTSTWITVNITKISDNTTRPEEQRYFLLEAARITAQGDAPEPDASGRLLTSVLALVGVAAVVVLAAAVLLWRIRASAVRQSFVRHTGGYGTVTGPAYQYEGFGKYEPVA